jgi:hypothetical protein
VCGVNTYSNTTGAASVDVCTTCPNNTFSASESKVPTDCTCVAGYTGADGTACTACAAGTYKTETGPSGCIACVSGTYSTKVAATSVDMCSSCWANSDSSSGSNEATDCSCDNGYYDSVKYDPP